MKNRIYFILFLLSFLSQNSFAVEKYICLSQNFDIIYEVTGADSILVEGPKGQMTLFASPFSSTRTTLFTDGINESSSDLAKIMGVKGEAQIFINFFYSKSSEKQMSLKWYDENQTTLERLVCDRI
jgi:hypothetical protein